MKLKKARASFSFSVSPLVGLLLGFVVCLAGCTANAGVFAGGNWKASGIVHQHIRTLTIDPNNAQRIDAGEDQGAIFTSADGAQHWIQATPGLSSAGTLLALSFSPDGKKLYAATSTGLYVSTDAAGHWNAVMTDLPSDQYTSFTFDYDTTNPRAGDTVYVGTAHHGALVSTDAGKSWSAAAPAFPTAVAVKGITLDYTQHQLWAATTQGVYRADTHRGGWKAMNTGLPSNSDVNTVQVASLSGGAKNLLFAGTTHGIYRSLDAGAHWLTSEETFSNVDVRSVLVDFRISNTTTVYMGTDIGVFRSDDNGQIWTRVASGWPQNEPVYALEFGATGYSQLLAAGNDVYLFPGNSGGVDLMRFLPVLLFAALFYLLYRFTGPARRRRARDASSPEKRVETPSP
jgi:photosystem II stability/assembly factor-like uncharacterized protein